MNTQLLTRVFPIGISFVCLALGCSSSATSVDAGGSGRAGTGANANDRGEAGKSAQGGSNMGGSVGLANGGSTSGGSSSGGSSQGGAGGEIGGTGGGAGGLSSGGSNQGGAGGEIGGTGGSSGSSSDNTADPCPPRPFFNCATDCGGVSACGFAFETGCAMTTNAAGGEWDVVRTPAASGTCKVCGRAAIGVVMPQGVFRVRVSPPWSLLPPPVSDNCAAGAQCIINGYAMTQPSYGRFVAITDDPNAPPRNISIEAVDSNATCP